MYGINYNGLRRRESYDDIVKYIETDPDKIRYPNRKASFLEQSHYMKFLGGEDYIAMEEQQLRASKEKVKEDIIREKSGGIATSSLVRDEVRRETKTPIVVSRSSGSTQTTAPSISSSFAQTTAPSISSSSAQTLTSKQNEASAQTLRSDTIASAVAEAVNRVVEDEKDKKTMKRFQNQRMIIEQLGNTTRIPEASMKADMVRSSSPIIQKVNDTEMEQAPQEEEVRFSKGEMKRMRKKGRFPEPYSKPISYNPNSSSSSDHVGSSASADYQKRLIEEELLRQEQEKLVSKQINEDKKKAVQKEPWKKRW